MDPKITCYKGTALYLFQIKHGVEIKYNTVMLWLQNILTSNFTKELKENDHKMVIFYNSFVKLPLYVAII